VIRSLPEVISAKDCNYCARTVQKQEFQIYAILIGDRKYDFLFIEDQLNTYDGRRILFLRTLSGIQRVEIKQGGKILYLGSRTVKEEKDVKSTAEYQEVTAACSAGAD
jgi:hypothetical protein